MTDWHFWAALCGMLWIGQWAGVGLFLRQFCMACAMVACISALFALALEQQLHLFLLLSAVQLIVGRLKRRRPLPPPSRRHA